MATQRRTQRLHKASKPAVVRDEADDTPTVLDIMRFALLQHAGLVLCVFGLALLALGYDREWMHNTHLSMLSLVLCLIGLFFHETRPYKVTLPGGSAARMLPG
jgi:hypothetical protein